MWYIINQQSVHVYFHHSLNGKRASYLIFSAGYMHLCKCNDSAAFFHHFQPICTRFLYTSEECACGTLQTNRQIKYNCLVLSLNVWRLDPSAEFFWQLRPADGRFRRIFGRPNFFPADFRRSKFFGDGGQIRRGRRLRGLPIGGPRSWI